MGFERETPLSKADDQSKLTPKQEEIGLYYDPEGNLRDRKGEKVTAAGIPLDRDGIPYTEPSPGRCNMPIKDPTSYPGSLCRAKVQPGRTCKNHPRDAAEILRREEAQQVEFRLAEFERRVLEEMARDDLLDHIEFVARLRVAARDLFAEMMRDPSLTTNAQINTFGSAIDTLGKAVERAKKAMTEPHVSVGDWGILITAINTVLAMMLDDDAMYGLFRERLAALTQDLLATPEHYILLKVPDDVELEPKSRKFAEGIVRLNWLDGETLELFNREPEEEEKSQAVKEPQTLLR